MNLDMEEEPLHFAIKTINQTLVGALLCSRYVPACEYQTYFRWKTAQVPAAYFKSETINNL